MGYNWNHLEKPVLMTVPKPFLIGFDIHDRVESCVRDTLLGAHTHNYSWQTLFNIHNV